ncbi:probable WRKY transcription factor protein 1 isoform X4 [Drosophila subobscura]|uniref:probable WRKY transcription factor protein 1 isoform X4 n=1 Tax=Drosophila subobscura TaxID=7241 RepID=UPI00155B0733|nr:probable WRKY transcription factor protein 1 isoform X4 [Drosophila subobscura]
MSVIIRLQNLPWTANARDIRNFFTGLSIPEGGVHIIGGENGDAFIAFSTDEDARVAMLKNCEKLMESQVRLLLSSRAEMQKVIESARTPVVAAAPVPVPVPVPMPVAAPQPPIIGGLNSFLSQSQSQSKPVGVPSFLDYQQQAGIVLAEVTGGRDIRRQSRSRSRSRSSSSEDSDRELRERERERERDRELERERERERDRAIRKRRQERADSAERELKLQSSSLSGIVAGGLSPWANPPQTAAAVSLPGLGMGMGLGLGLGLGGPPVLPSLQNYTTSNTTNNITNNYNMPNANGPSTPAPAPPLAPDAHKLIAALQAAARAGSNSPAQMEGQQQVLRQAVEQPVAFASVNPYAQIYPQLFQQQQQQQQMPQQNHMQPFVNTGPMANGMLPFVVQQQLQQLQQQQQQQNNGGGPNFPFNNNNNNNNNNMDIQNRNMNHNGGGGGSMDQSINRNHNGGGPFGGMPMPQNQNEGVRPPRQEDNFVRVHNCEYATRVNDLGELFSLENLRIEHIEMLLNDRNQSSGEFIVEFADGPNAKQAIREFHNRRFRGRGLRVVPITPQEIADRMNKPFMDYLPGGNGPRRTDNGGNSAQVSAQPTSRRRGPSRFDNNQQQQQAPPERQRQEDEDSNSSQKQHFNPFARPDPPAIASGSLSPALNVSNSSSSGSSIPDKFNRPGCVVAMTNVPFKAELKDILRFFSDYKLSPDDIIRRFNDDGKPTGDTRVAFESAAEARSAYETRRRKQIFTRSIHLEII